LENAIEACWPRDTLLVTKLDRLARSAVDTSSIAELAQLFDVARVAVYRATTRGKTDDSTLTLPSAP
jgi:DNA invertase Pin-like site-specific DNA recombinase